MQYSFSFTVSNGNVPQTPESVRSATVHKAKSKDIIQMKQALKSASEPNLSKSFFLVYLIHCLTLHKESLSNLD